MKIKMVFNYVEDHKKLKFKKTVFSFSGTNYVKIVVAGEEVKNAVGKNQQMTVWKAETVLQV